MVHGRVSMLTGRGTTAKRLKIIASACIFLSASGAHRRSWSSSCATASWLATAAHRGQSDGPSSLRAAIACARGYSVAAWSCEKALQGHVRL